MNGHGLLPPSSLLAAAVSFGRGAPGFTAHASSAVFSGVRISAASPTRCLGSDINSRREMKREVIENEGQPMVGVSQTSSRRFVWSKERSEFLICFLVEQASTLKGKGKESKDAMFRGDNLLEVAEAVSQRFQRECGVADVRRMLSTLREKWRRIEKIKVLTSASWDQATRMAIMREDDYQQFSQDHPKDSLLLNKPIVDYDDLSLIFSDRSAAEIRMNKDQCDRSAENNISDNMMEQKVDTEDIHYLVLKIGELIDAVKTLKPRDFADDLWKAVTACDYNERMSITAFEYFLKNEVEGNIFLVRSPELRKEWLAKFFSSFL